MNTQFYTPTKALYKQIAAFWILLMILTGSLQATNYYTIQAGAWDDQVSVWSTNGLSPCGCSPLTQVIFPTDSIFVSYDISFSNQTTINGVTTITPKGQLTGNQQLVINGELHNYNYVQCRQMRVNFNGWLNNQAPLTFSMGDLVNLGGTVDLGSSVAFYFGGINNQAGGTINFLTGSMVDVTFSITNEGIINLDPNNCLLVGVDLNNPATGTVNGEGYVMVTNSITNSGIWGNLVKWCSGGPTVGLSTIPTCNNCGGALGVEILSFTGSADEASGGSNLEWITSSESGVSGYLLEKSLDGESFTELATIDVQAGAGSGSEHKKSYNYSDLSRLGATTTYRLSEISVEGETSYLGRVEVNPSMGAASYDFEVYPNPFAGELNLGFMGSEAGDLEVSLFDLQGRLLMQQAFGEVQPGARLSLEPQGLEAGFYMLWVKEAGTGRTFTKRVVKQ